MGRTWPRKVISPVIPRCGLTFRPVITGRQGAVAIVTPADGPSFGDAPAGICKWRSFRLKNSDEIPSESARERTYDKAARADSCITFPIEPVIWKPRPPAMRVASTNNTSPPNGVYARPGTMPGMEVRAFSSSVPRRSDVQGIPRSIRV